MSLSVYLNGQILPYEQAMIPVEDRAFLFADGVYEVVRVYGGKPFTINEHFERLVRSARAIKLVDPDIGELSRVSLELIRTNQVTEGTLYIQISRGAYSPRTHAFPPGPARPNVLILSRPVFRDPAQWSSGVSAITVPDQRWSRCDIKSVALLPNVLAKQAAAEAGAYEAIFIRDGFALEGSSSNFMAVLDGEIRTYPQCNYILGGITRNVVLELARNLGYPVREEGIAAVDLARCAESWITSTTSEVLPVISLDGRPVGDGRPGPVASAIHSAFVRRYTSL